MDRSDKAPERGTTCSWVQREGKKMISREGSLDQNMTQGLSQTTEGWQSLVKNLPSNGSWIIRLPWIIWQWQGDTVRSVFYILCMHMGNVHICHYSSATGLSQVTSPLWLLMISSLKCKKVKNNNKKQQTLMCALYPKSVMKVKWDSEYNYY